MIFTEVKKQTFKSESFCRASFAEGKVKKGVKVAPYLNLQPKSKISETLISESPIRLYGVVP
jgi:hypothetical protein